jgi:hypothetical protein
MKQALYKIGDTVKIKDLTTLKQELGNSIRAQCGWYRPTMDKYAGGTYVVVDVIKSTRNGLHYSYKLDGCGRWWFSEDTMEPPETAPYISMGYDELMNCTWQEKGGCV